MLRAVVLAASAVALAALLGAADVTARQAQNPRLVATVGPGFTISLTDPTGARVASLSPGTYDIEVRDLSAEHNFHLTGPGVDRATAVETEGSETWTVTLTDGVYTYVCDPHSTQMTSSVAVGNAQPPPPQPAPAPTPAPPPSKAITAKTKLVLASGPGFTITLKTAAGARVRSMKRGTYTVTVRDRSRIHNAHVRAPGYNRATTLPFTGAQTWKAKLAKTGTLRFLCDPHVLQGMKGSAKIVP